MKFYITFFLSLVLFQGFAQSEQDKIRELEQQREFERARKVRMVMDSGIVFMERGEYDVADSKFRYTLSHLGSIPSDLTFYFGKNSYFLGKFKQSVDWLTKYVQLKGTSGQHSVETAEILKSAEAALLAQREVESLKAAEVFSRDFTIDCGPSGKAMCPVCNGTTVIIKKDYFGETYKACPYCDSHGNLSCADYNLLLKGQLKPVAGR